MTGRDTRKEAESWSQGVRTVYEEKIMEAPEELFWNVASARFPAGVEAY